MSRARTFVVTAALALGAGALFIPSLADAEPAPQATCFRPVHPTRVFDSRELGAPIPAGHTRSVQLGEDATAAAVNVQVVDPTADGYVTVWPLGTPEPGTATVNFQSGETESNSAIIGGGSRGALQFTSPLAATHIVIDLTGVYTASC